MTEDDPTALANQHNAEVYNRIISRLHDVYRLMAEFRYWVYKLDGLSGTPLVESERLVSRPGWTPAECARLIEATPYPANMDAMRAAVAAAKAEETAKKKS